MDNYINGHYVYTVCHGGTF